jgi:hypothetical protein
MAPAASGSHRGSAPAGSHGTAHDSDRRLHGTSKRTERVIDTGRQERRKTTGRKIFQLGQTRNKCFAALSQLNSTHEPSCPEPKGVSPPPAPPPLTSAALLRMALRVSGSGEIITLAHTARWAQPPGLRRGCTGTLSDGGRPRSTCLTWKGGGRREGPVLSDSTCPRIEMNLRRGHGLFDNASVKYMERMIARTTSSSTLWSRSRRDTRRAWMISFSEMSRPTTCPAKHRHVETDRLGSKPTTV